MKGTISSTMIRQALPTDGMQIVSLIKAILSAEFPADQGAYPTQDLERLTQTYAGPLNTFFVAEENQKIVGTCGVMADGKETAILRRLFVDPNSRGKGIGSELLKAALVFCRQKGFQEIVIRTSSRMEQAIRLCCAQGFQEDGVWDLGQVKLIRFRLKLT